MLLYSDGGTKAQEDEAEEILGVLTFAYPNHPWAVRVYEGGFFVRHLDFPTNWGMNFKYKTSAYSASALKREIIMKAGEWLERANLRRGVGNDDPTKFVEGVPQQYQPKEAKEAIALKAIDKAVEDARQFDAQASREAKIELSTQIDAALREKPRETPRPQAVKGL